MACLATALAAVHAPAARRTAARRSATLHYSSDSGIQVPDASDNGTGVSAAVLECGSSHPAAVGGGAQISGRESGLDLEIKSSAPTQAGSLWQIEANNSSGHKASMAVHAICAKGNFVFAHKDGDPVAPGAEGGARVSCPPHTELAGGGVKTFGGDHTTEVGDTEPADGNDSDSKRDDGWVAGVNNGSTNTVDFRVDAVCAKRGTYKVVSSGPKRLPDGSQVAATARCPQGSQVTSGGVRITGTDSDLEVAQSFPFDNFDRDHVPDNGWRGAANNQSSGQPQRMETFAVCKT